MKVHGFELADPRQYEHKCLRDAQLIMLDAAAEIDEAARARAAQGDKHAERDAATYREVARILRGERDDAIADALESDAGLAGIFPIVTALDLDALARMIRNTPPK